MASTAEQLVPEERLSLSPQNGRSCGAMEAAIADRLIEQYRQQVQRIGYAKAINDMRAMLVWIAEQYLKEHPDKRKEVYFMVSHFEKAMVNLPRNDYVEGGLGI